METIEMHLPFNTTLEEGIKMLRQKAEQTGMQVIAKFNGFTLDSQYSDEENKTRITNHFRKKITDHVKKMLTDRETCNINWEQRRYEIAKEMLPFCMKRAGTKFPSLTVYNIVRGSAKCAVRIADALIKELKGEVVRND